MLDDFGWCREIGGSMIYNIYIYIMYTVDQNCLFSHRVKIVGDGAGKATPEDGCMEDCQYLYNTFVWFWVVSVDTDSTKRTCCAMAVYK